MECPANGQRCITDLLQISAQVANHQQSYALSTAAVVWLETTSNGVWIEKSPVYQYLKGKFNKDHIAYGAMFLNAVFTYSITPLVATSLKAATLGGLDNDHPREQARRATGMAARALAAHTNAIETFPLVIAATIAARASKVPLRYQSHFTSLHLIFRLIHWVAYLLNLSAIRSFAWIAGVVSLYLLMGFALLPGFEATYLGLSFRSDLFIRNLTQPWKMLGF